MILSLRSPFVLMTFVTIFILLSTSLSAPASKKMTYTLGDNVKGDWIIDTNTANVIDLLLPGNPTTGYSWYIKNFEQAKGNNLVSLNLNKLNSTDSVSSDPKNKALGVGGLFDFQFLTVISGKVDLVFEYKRPWENVSIRNVTAKLNIK